MVNDMNKTYTDGLNDVWKLLKLYYDMEVGERQEVFGEYTIGKLLDMPIQTVLDKLEAYEKSKEIKVGDVVEQNEHKFVIIFVNGEYVNGIDEDGRFSNISIKNCKKTGRHIDITSVLEQLRGE